MLKTVGIFSFVCILSWFFYEKKATSLMSSRKILFMKDFIADSDYKEFTDASQSDLIRKVKRRIKRSSLEDSQLNNTLNETVMSVDEISNFIKMYSNLLIPFTCDPNRWQYSSQLFRILPYAYKSLASCVQKVKMKYIASKHITLYVDKIEIIIPNLSYHLSNDEQVLFTSLVKNKYGSWACNNHSESCKGFILMVTTITDDFFSLQNRSSNMLSRIIGLHLINPSPNGAYEFLNTEDTAQGIELNFAINTSQIPMQSFPECRIWNFSNQEWDSTACTTDFNNFQTYTVCICSETGYVAIFEKLTRVTMTTMSTQVVNHTICTAPKTEEILDRKYCRFSFNADYNDVILRCPAQLLATNHICDSVRNDLLLDPFQFQNCLLSPGSIIIEFIILKENKTMNTTLNFLQFLVNHNSFTVKTFDDMKLNSIAGSLEISETDFFIKTTPQNVSISTAINTTLHMDTKKINEHNLIIALSVMATIIGLLLLVLGAFVVLRKKNSLPLHRVVKTGVVNIQNNANIVGATNPNFVNEQSIC